MLLASITEIMQRLGFDQMTDIEFATTMALDAATPQIEATLNTSFAQNSYVETFYVERPPYQVRQAVRTRFRLNNGFVSQLTSVKTAYAYADFTTAGANPKDVTSTIKLDADRGLLDDVANGYANQYVQVAYTAGFPVDGTNPASYDLSAVPDWLQEAAKLRALVGMADSASLTEANIKLDVKTLWVQFNALVSRKLRYAPTAKMPL